MRRNWATVSWSCAFGVRFLWGLAQNLFEPAASCWNRSLVLSRKGTHIPTLDALTNSIGPLTQFRIKYIFSWIQSWSSLVIAHLFSNWWNWILKNWKVCTSWLTAGSSYDQAHEGDTDMIYPKILQISYLMCSRTVPLVISQNSVRYLLIMSSDLLINTLPMIWGVFNSGEQHFTSLIDETHKTYLIRWLSI